MKSAQVLWFTGLSGSGKTTLANKLAKVLKNKKYSVEIIDGDEFREKVHPDLSFTPKEIKINNKKIITYCLKQLQKKDFILVPVIAPFQSTRNFAQKMLKKSYTEIFCNSSLKKCIQRDTKGLYKKAMVGQLKNFIGFDKNVPYEIPKKPDLVINTEKFKTENSIKLLLNFLEHKNII